METRNLRKERIGVVTSNKMEKSIVVSEVKRMKHPMYGKFVIKTKHHGDAPIVEEQALEISRNYRKS